MWSYDIHFSILISSINWHKTNFPLLKHRQYYCGVMLILSISCSSYHRVVDYTWYRYEALFLSKWYWHWHIIHIHKYTHFDREIDTYVIIAWTNEMPKMYELKIDTPSKATKVLESLNGNWPHSEEFWTQNMETYTRTRIANKQASDGKRERELVCKRNYRYQISVFSNSTHMK